MGCDIHAMYERKVLRSRYRNAFLEWHEDYSWVAGGEPYWLHRNYQLFGVLGGVRGSGPPIGRDRIKEDEGSYSIPGVTWDEDLSEVFQGWCRGYGQDGHSHSFVTLKELKVRFWSMPPTEEYEEIALPKSKVWDWTTGLPPVKMVTRPSHLRKILGRLIREMDRLRLRKDDESVRLVFFFDN